MKEASRNYGLYRPVEVGPAVQAELSADERLQFSFRLVPGKKALFGLFEPVVGVQFGCHLTSRRLVLESKVDSAAGFFAAKGLVSVLHLAASAYGVNTSVAAKSNSQRWLTEGRQYADAVRDQVLSIPLDSISRFESQFPWWARIVLKEVTPGSIDPNALVFLVYPPPGRSYFKTSRSTAPEFVSVGNQLLQDTPCDGIVFI